MENKPQVGVGVIILDDKKVLLGKRKGSHGEGTWSFPGGHLEFNEEIEDCAKREVEEETGILLKNIRRGPFTNDIFEKENKHYVTIFVIAEKKMGDVKLLEPDKCEEWKWFSWDNLPKPLFLPVQTLIRTGFNPFTYKK